MYLGWFELGLDVRNIEKSLKFYEALGFQLVEGSIEERTVTLQKDDCRLALYQGYIKGNQLIFRGGDVRNIAHEATQKGLSFETEPFVGDDGGTGAMLRDPDGNGVYLVNHPGEVRRGPR